MIEIKDHRIYITLNGQSVELNPYSDIIDSIIRPFAYYFIFGYPLDVVLRTTDGYITYAEIGWDNFMVCHDTTISYTSMKPKVFFNELYRSLQIYYDDWVYLYSNGDDAIAEKIIDDYLEEIRVLAEEGRHIFTSEYKGVPYTPPIEAFRLDGEKVFFDLPIAGETEIVSSAENINMLLAAIKFWYVNDAPFAVCFDTEDGQCGVYDVGDYFLTFIRGDDVMLYLTEADAEVYLLGLWYGFDPEYFKDLFGDDDLLYESYYLYGLDQYPPGERVRKAM